MKIYFTLMFSLLLMPTLALADDKPAAEIISKKTAYGEISYPVLSGVADKNIENSINKIIEEEAASWNCDFDGVPENPEGKDYNAWTTIKLIDENYLSYTVGKDYYCGGAHPNQHIDTRTYDLKQGNPISIDGLLVPELLDEKLTAYLLKDHKFDEEGCDDAYEGIKWDYYRTADNIVFLPRLYGNSNVCWDEFPVGIAKIKDYMWSELEEDRD